MSDMIGWYLWYKANELYLAPMLVVIGMALLKWGGGKAWTGGKWLGSAVKDRYVAFRKPKERSDELCNLLLMQSAASKKRGESVIRYAGRVFYDDGRVYVEVIGEKGLEDVEVPLEKWEKTILMRGFTKRVKEVDAQHAANVRMAASSGAIDLKESGDLIETKPKKA